MSLADALAYAQQHNPRIAEAAALVREAQARIGQRLAVARPQLNSNTFVIRQGPVVPGRNGAPPSVPLYRYNVGFSVSQVIFDWGQRTAQTQVARKDAAAAVARLAEAENDLRFVVSVAFYNVHRAEELLKVARERSTATAEQLRVAKARFDANVAPRFDVIRAEAEAANAQLDVIRGDNEISLAQAAFNTALGREVLTPVSLVLSPRPQPGAITLADAQAVALRHRPQLAALRSSIEGRQAEVRSRRAEQKPQVSMTGAYDRTNPGGFASQTFRYNVGLVMTFPFFDGGLVKARIREALATLGQQHQALEAARQQIDLDLQQAILDIREAQQRRDTAQKEQLSAREALRVAGVRYRSGVGTNVEVTDAQVAVSRAGQEVANAVFDLQVALARLESAMGVSLETLASAHAGGATAPVREGTAGAEANNTSTTRQASVDAPPLSEPSRRLPPRRP
jgi:outer membrane protein